MKLFTRRFIIDLILIVVFGTVLYVLIHNPITHPVPETKKGMWSIQLMQYPLVFGIAGHNYLTLNDEKNLTIKEIHGLATTEVNGTSSWKYIGTQQTDTLKVWEFDSPHYYIANKSFPGIVLYEGTKTETVSIWNRSTSCKKEINEKNIPYPPYGVNVRGDTENSNSVAYTLTLCMGLSTRHLGLFTPGSTKNLLDEIFETQAVNQ